MLDIQPIIITERNGIQEESLVGGVIVLAIVAQLNLMTAIGHIDGAGIGIVADVVKISSFALVSQSVTIEHDAVTHCKAPSGQGIGELQVGVVIEDMPTPVSGLLLCHEVIALDTRHHRQVLGKQRRIQFDNIHGQLVADEEVAGILIAA